MRDSTWLGLLLCSCASVASERLDLHEAPEDRTTMEIVPLDERALPPTEAAPDAGAGCPVEIAPPPAASTVPSTPSGSCRPVPRAVRMKLARAAREEWVLGHQNAKLNVEHGCDAMTPSIGELIFETSEGHGFSLVLDRIRPRDDGDYDLVRLEYGAFGKRIERNAASDWDWAAALGGRVRAAVLPGDRVEAMLIELRAALHLRLAEHKPPPQRDGVEDLSFSMSSRDFHVGYRLVDERGRGLQGFWAGYQGSEDQEQWIPLDLAAAAYGELLWADDIEALLAERSPTPDDRDFFVERFAAARDRGEDYGYWYVQERLLAMARDLGDVRLMADLLELAGRSGEHGVVRAQTAAVDVLVVLTGYDPRHDDTGTARTTEDAAADMRALCG